MKNVFAEWVIHQISADFIPFSLFAICNSYSALKQKFLKLLNTVDSAIGLIALFTKTKVTNMLNSKTFKNSKKVPDFLLNNAQV